MLFKNFRNIAKQSELRSENSKDLNADVHFCGIKDDIQIHMDVL